MLMLWNWSWEAGDTAEVAHGAAAAAADALNVTAADTAAGLTRIYSDLPRKIFSSRVSA